MFRQKILENNISLLIRSKVGGLSKPSLCFAGWDRLGTFKGKRLKICGNLWNLWDNSKDGIVSLFPKISLAETFLSLLYNNVERTQMRNISPQEIVQRKFRT